MDTYGIPHLGLAPGSMPGAMPSYGVGSLNRQRDRGGKRRPFERALGKANKDVGDDSRSVAQDDTPNDGSEEPLSLALQDDGSIGRKDEQDRQLHVDIIV